MMPPMKKYPSLLAFFLGITLVSFAIPPATKVISEGKVEYTVDASSMDPTMAAFMQGMSMVAYFNEDQLRVDMNMGMMGTTTSIGNAKTNESIILMNVMGNKLAVNKMPDTNAPEWTMQTTSETKTIAGYVCKKTILKSDEGTLVFYVTDQISTPKVKSELQLEKLNGYPLQIELSAGSESFFMVATKVTPGPVDKAKFNTSVPEGYEVITAEDMMKMVGGFMGQ